MPPACSAASEARTSRPDVAKLVAARLGEEVAGEYMHILGGSGFLVEETPMGRWRRDMKLARVGAGADEVLWEPVAAGLKPDYDSYDALVGRSSA